MKPQHRAIWGYLAMSLGLVLDIGHALATHEGPITARTVLVTALIVWGTRKTHKAPPPGARAELEPTDHLEVEDGGAELGKASGEAGRAASRAVSRARAGASAVSGEVLAPEAWRAGK